MSSERSESAAGLRRRRLRRHARSPRSLCRAARLALGLGLVAGSTAAPLQESSAPAAGREGPLQNDALVAGSIEVARLLAGGDAALGRLSAAALAGQARPSDAERLALVAATDGWTQALAAAAPGEPVPLDLGAWLPADGFRWPDPEGSAGRRWEALEYALLRRLLLGPPALRELWRERQGPAALESLALAGERAAGLARVEHLHPGTSGASLAALRLFELDLERGLPELGRSWLERARLHAQVCGDAELLAAVARRESFLAAQAPAARPPAPWESASRLRAAGPAHVLPPPEASSQRSWPASPSLAFLSAGRVALVLPDVVWVVDPGGRSRGFEPGVFVESLGIAPPPPIGGPDSSWLLAPATDGERLFLAVGRAGGRATAETGAAGRSNMLACLLPPAGVGLPELVWALGPEEHVAPGAPRVPLAEVLGPGMWEFQPGPLLLGATLVVQARQWLLEQRGERLEVASPSEARLWVLALDAATGGLRWKRFLGRGTEVVSELGSRLRRQGLVRTAAQPLAAQDGRVLAGTNLGLALLLDLCDGRLVWSFANRRHDPGAPGWRCLRPPPLVEGREGEPGLAIWAPSDSDHAYWLRLAPDLDGRGLLAHPPHPQGEAEEVVGGGREELLVLSRSGARRTLASHAAQSGRRVDSFYLGRGESFVPGALLSARRALFASSRGLFLLDRERELYLLAELPLALELAGPPGGLFADERAVWLLADRKLWRFEVDG